MTEEFLADTQTQSSQVDWIPSSVPAIPLIWGRLYFAHKTHNKHCWRTEQKYPDYIDLVNDEFRLGRSMNCDFTTAGNFITDEILSNISKHHFVLRRDIKEKLSPAFVVDESYNGTFVNGIRIGRGKKRLLDDGDEISITHPNIKIFVYKDLLKNEQSDVSTVVTSRYYVSKVLGQGACGVVKLVYKKDTGSKYAMKIIKKCTLSTVPTNKLNDLQKIKNEINILKSVQHPCIVRTYEVLECPKAVYIVMEYLEGGELFEIVTSMGRLPEKFAQVLMRQVVLAVLHLHERGITHRDLKLENVLLESPSLDTVAKVTDFGLSKCMGEEGFMKTVCGTPLYIAPELLTGKKYGPQVDVWSLGVMIFVCLSGYMPFSNDYGESLRGQITGGKYRYSPNHWKGVSREARRLVKAMLTPDPKARIKLVDVLNHSWLQKPEVISKVEELLSHSAQVKHLSQLSVDNNNEQDNDENQENRTPSHIGKCKRTLSGTSSSGCDSIPAAKRHRLGLVRQKPRTTSSGTNSIGSNDLTTEADNTKC